jgi:hypothetical protein
MTRRAATCDEWIVAAAWAAGSALVFAGRAWLPALATLAPDCPFHALTGLPCLACGTTRAALLLAQGDPAGAFLMNPLATFTLAAAWLGGFVAPAWLALGLPMPHVPRALPVWARVALITLLAANWCFLVVRGV